MTCFSFNVSYTTSVTSPFVVPIVVVVLMVVRLRVTSFTAYILVVREDHCEGDWVLIDRKVVEV